MTRIELRESAERFCSVAAGLEVKTLHGADAARLLELAGRVEAAAAALRGRLAARVEETKSWNDDAHRSVEEFVAAKTGKSPGQIASSLKAARELEQFDGTREEFAKGLLSEEQAATIADAASDDPSAERRLRDTAKRRPLAGLRREAGRVKAQAGEAAERYARVHRDRHLRGVETAYGSVRVFGEVTKDWWARFRSLAQPYQDEIFAAARHEGRRERPDAYFVDAVLAMAEAAAERAGGSKGTGGSKGKGPRRAPASIHLIYDVGKRACEIVGLGAVPPEVAAMFADDAAFTALLTDGVDVHRHISFKRHVAKVVADSVFGRDRKCAVPACEVTVGLERDHADDFAGGGPTSYANLQLLCGFHHDQKTHRGYRLEGPAGDRRWTGPDQRVLSADNPDLVGTDASPSPPERPPPERPFEPPASESTVEPALFAHATR